MQAKANELDIDEPAISTVRRRKLPQRYEEGSRGHVFDSTEDIFRQRFYEAAGSVNLSLDERYPPATWHHMKEIEDFVTGKGDSTYVSTFYRTDFDAERLQLHRDMMLDIAKQRNVAPLKALQDVVDLFSGDAGEHLRELLPEMTNLLKIALTVPVTSCTSERSFSCLRRVKTYLRSTMSQVRLNHVALLHGHKQLAYKISLPDIANKFIVRASVRRNTFSL